MQHRNGTEMQHRASFTLFAALALVLAACNKQAAPEPMGESAPAFGSSEQYKTVAGFIEGRWSPSFGIDPATAALFGLTPEEANDPETAIYWEFSSDGTFFYSEGRSKSRISGTWRENKDGVSLTYEKWNDEPLMDAQLRFQKEAESGRMEAIAKEMVMEDVFKTIIPMNYFELSKDGKKLVFTDPRAENDMFEVGTEMVRLQPPPD